MRGGAHRGDCRLDARCDLCRRQVSDGFEAVFVLVGDPFDTVALDEIRVLFGKPVEATVAPSEKIEDAINRVYERDAGGGELESNEEHVDDVGWRLLGLKVKDKSRTDAVAITSVRRGSAADRAGIRPGDLLVALGGVVTESVGAYRHAVSALRGAADVQLAIQRGPAQYRLTLPIE